MTKKANMIRSFFYDDVVEAYDKLKSFVYYDNFSLDLRVKLATYESSGIDLNLKLLADKLTNCYTLKKCSPLDDLFSQITYRVLPKKFLNNNNDGIFTITNINEKSEYVIDKVTYFIDCPVELHIISFLWILKIGVNLDSKLSKSCYANRLLANISSNNNWHKRTFPRYFERYQKWRDTAVNEALICHKNKDNVAILSLDIENYYDSVNFDLSSIKDDGNTFGFLTNILNEIHLCYKLKRNIENNILPIGLISSGILANYYLLDFDKEIVDTINPRYYGRYVDDILIVVQNPVYKDNFDKFVMDNFAKSKSLSVENSKLSLKIGANTLSFQKSKIKFYYFSASEPITTLIEFKKNIIKNSSEFRFLPDHHTLFSDFHSKAFNVTYSDTINKIRSIESIDTNKYGASKHLANILFNIKNVGELDSDIISKINKQIDEFFAGERNLQLLDLWEKVFNIFVINRQKYHLIKFLDKTIKDILRISHDNKSVITLSLVKHLVHSLSMAIALDIPFYKDDILDTLNSNIKKYKSLSISFLPIFDAKEIKSIAISVVKSNLFRHTYSLYPLLYLCNQPESMSFRRPILTNKDTMFTITKSKYLYFPKFISFHELCIFYTIKSLYSNSDLPTYKTIINKYFEINNINKNKYSDYPNAIDNKNLDIKKIFFSKSQDKYFDLNKINIAIVNTRVRFEDSLSNFIGKPRLTLDRLDTLNQVLNSCLKERSNFVLFPEICIPFQWVGHLAEFSRRNKIAIICGIEHISNTKKEVFNYSCAILPFSTNGFGNILIDFRIKKDYSPGEIKQIVNRGFKIPKKSEIEKLRLFQYQDSIFTVFNCYELADIDKRSIFKGKVDMVFAIEYNKDIEYFANIVESSARDIHCYMIQSNNSTFGDSRATRPGKSYFKDIAQIKGGNNTTIINCIIDVNDLREFQQLEYELQKEHPIFKPTPPNFEFPLNRK